MHGGASYNSGHLTRWSELGPDRLACQSVKHSLESATPKRNHVAAGTYMDMRSTEAPCVRLLLVH